MTDTGFNKRPTVTRVNAPAMRFPWAVNLGRVEVEYEDDGARRGAKYGDVARKPRNWVRPVKYSATPGTFRRSEGAVPRQRPRSPSDWMIFLAVRNMSVD